MKTILVLLLLMSVNVYSGSWVRSDLSPQNNNAVVNTLNPSSWVLNTNPSSHSGQTVVKVENISPNGISSTTTGSASNGSAEVTVETKAGSDGDYRAYLACNHGLTLGCYTTYPNCRCVNGCSPGACMIQSRDGVIDATATREADSSIHPRMVYSGEWTCNGKTVQVSAKLNVSWSVSADSDDGTMAAATTTMSGNATCSGYGFSKNSGSLDNDVNFTVSKSHTESDAFDQNLGLNLTQKGVSISLVKFNKVPGWTDDSYSDSGSGTVAFRHTMALGLDNNQPAGCQVDFYSNASATASTEDDAEVCTVNCKAYVSEITWKDI